MSSTAWLELHKFYINETYLLSRMTAIDHYAAQMAHAKCYINCDIGGNYQRLL